MEQSLKFFLKGIKTEKLGVVRPTLNPNVALIHKRKPSLNKGERWIYSYYLAFICAQKAIKTHQIGMEQAFAIAMKLKNKGV